MNAFTEAAVTVASLIVGVAALAVIVSRNSNTTGVIQSVASGFGNALGVAEAPVTGAHTPINLSYPGGSGFGLPNLSAGAPGL